MSRSPYSLPYRWIYIENGHISFFTFAVTDVDKGQISGGSDHGNNVIVMSFNGEMFDKETGRVGVEKGPQITSNIRGKDSHMVKNGAMRYDLRGRAMGTNGFLNPGVFILKIPEGNALEKYFCFGK